MKLVRKSGGIRKRLGGKERDRVDPKALYI